jgi:RNA polymerase sigma-70 factor, ECF subfamily
MTAGTTTQTHSEARDVAAREAELTRRAVGGSFAAFEELVHLFEKRIYGFVYQACSNEADAKEITQDTFVRAFQALNQFDLKYPFGPWLFAIARRKCLDFFRARRPASDHDIPEIADARDPSFLLAQGEERRNLWSLARHSLKPIEFEVLWLKYVEDMDVAEIARVVRKTRTHVKVILFRARRSLGQALQINSLEATATYTPVVVTPGATRINTAAV